MFALQIRHWLGHGITTQPGAGWDVAEPRPIPLTGANETLANAPPQMRYGSNTGGLTFVVRSKPNPASEDGVALQSLMNALGFSLGLPAVVMGEREDPRIADGTIVVVIGQKGID